MNGYCDVPYCRKEKRVEYQWTGAFKPFSKELCREHEIQACDISDKLKLQMMQAIEIVCKEMPMPITAREGQQKLPE